MTNQASEDIDKILGSSHCDFTPEDINEYSYSQKCKWCGAIRANSRHQMKQSILDWHTKQVLEIIGDDQSQKRPEGGKNTAEWTNGRNNLRQQQRNKLKESTDE